MSLTYVGAPVIALPQGRMVANKISGSRQAIGNGGTETEPHANSHPPAVRGSFLSMASNMERKPFDTTSNRTSRSSISRVKYAMGLCADDPRTPKGRRNQMAKILFMAGLPIVILLAQTITSTVQALREQGHANAFIVEVDFAIQAGAVVHALGLERGTSTFFVGHPDGAQGEMLFKPVVVRRQAVDVALQAMTKWPDNVPSEDSFFRTKQDLMLQILMNRFTLNSSTPELQLKFFTKTIAYLLRWIGDAIVRSQSTDQKWQPLVGYHLFISAKEGYAAERSAGTVLYSKGYMSNETYLWYQDQQSQGDCLMFKSQQYDPFIKEELRAHWENTELQRNISNERALMNRGNIGEPDVQRGLFWYAQMTAYQGILYEIEKKLTRTITEDLRDSVAEAASTVGLQLFVTVLAIFLFPSIILMLTHIMRQVQNFAALLSLKNDEIMLEKKRAEAVLNNLLPRAVAEKIKLGQPIYPESYDQASVFFSDVVQFTDFSAASTPIQVVDTLNKLYTVMDRRIEVYDVYKVETIGDAYLCASGLPERNGSKHSYEIAAMSLELLKDVSAVRIPHKPDYELRLRIGLHTGPCIAGIIGTKMPRYCIFGDTVNTASRMESNGEARKIHMSLAMYNALNLFGDFEMELRGDMQIKGKGVMTTYWLLSKKEPKRKLFGPEVHG